MDSLPKKKLIEHSLPLDAINAASSREKSVRHGHPSTLHLWWARRPLAACRAVIFAQLVDDPCSWPDEFPEKEDQDRERRRLHKIIEEMVEWPKSNAKDQQRFKRAIAAARFEIARSIAREQERELPVEHDGEAVLAFLQEHGPPVYDPFCGGGSIPLEAQRLGLRAYGSDLNPVAVLITKALIEFPPKFAGQPPIHPDVTQEAESDRDLAGRNWEGAQGLAEDVRRYGKWMRDEAERRIGHLYPKAQLGDGSEATVVAWLWTRTVASPDPAQGGVHVPLASSFVLSTKKGKEAIAIPVRDADATDGWRFEVKCEGVTKEEMATAKKGTIDRSAGGICILSGANMPFSYLRSQGKKGALSDRLMAVVAETKTGKTYLSPHGSHESIGKIDVDPPPISGQINHWPGCTNVVVYGMSHFSDLFTPRQLKMLAIFSDLVSEVREKVLKDSNDKKGVFSNGENISLAEGGRSSKAYADAIAIYMGLALGKLVDLSSTSAGWIAGLGAIRNTFGRHALPMVWDYAECQPFFKWDGALNWIALTLNQLPASGHGSAELLNAPDNNFPIRPSLVSTDPPYYDNIPYADLSDFFYLWHRRSLREIYPHLYRRLETEKDKELVAKQHSQGGKSAAETFFIEGMSKAIRAMGRASTDMPLAIYYAFKQSEIADEGILSSGWATFLQAVVEAGLQVDGTWPVRSERGSRMRSLGANALASSVVLVCRPRDANAATISRRDFQRELRLAMQQALADQQESIPLPDRRQAAIGPGIGVFSKYARVREADDSEMSVATALALINREIDTILAEGTESLDAESRFALDWYAMHSFEEQKSGSGQAISMLQGFNLSEGQMNRSGLFRAAGGNAKLLNRKEMAEAFRERHRTEWRPIHDDTPTGWEMAQHLARILRAQNGGVEACGRLLAERRDAGPDVLLIAERLYDMENNRGNAAEALVWNELQQAWAAISAAADRAEADGVGPRAVQEEMWRK